MKTIHVIPVPACMTTDDAFDEIEIMGELVEQRTWWRRAWCRVRHGRRVWATVEVIADEGDG